MEPISFDYIIVGGGTAGCTLASRLNKIHPSRSIALIESGPDQADHPLIMNPFGSAQLGGTGLQVEYQTASQPGLSDRSINLRRGNVLSGSSAINAGQWQRGHAGDYQRWADLSGDPRWKFENMLPYFRRIENHWNKNADSQYHGFEGPIHTLGGREFPLSKAMYDALISAGHKFNPDPFDGEPIGFAKSTENWHATSASESHRQPAGMIMDRGEINIMTDTVVRRVILDKHDGSDDYIATGVELASGRTLTAKRETVISTGGIKTPQLLMLSGIGPADQLDAIGISQLVDAPDVGCNLWDHIAFHQVWKLKHPENGLAIGHPDFMRNPTHLLGYPIDWWAYATMSSNLLKEALLRDDPSVNDSHASLIPGRAHHTIAIVYRPIFSTHVPMDGSYIDTGAMMLLPASRGHIRLTSLNAYDEPLIDPQYRSTYADRVTLREGARRAMEIMETPALKDIVAGETPPPAMKVLTSKSSDEDIDERIGHGTNTWNHSSGTAAMGKVVDGELKVKGVKGLRVVDASVMPAPISATPQATIYAIAEMAAEMIAAQN